MAQDFCTAYLELTSCETSSVFDKMFEILVKESAEVFEFLKAHKLASDELEASEILPLVRACEETLAVPESIKDMWFWSPVKALEYVQHEFETVGFPLATLKMYLKSNSKEIYEAGHCEKTEICFGKLLNKSCEELVQKCESTKEELVDALAKHEIAHWTEIISEKFLDNRKEHGAEEDEFVEAMRFVNILSYAWKKLSIASKPAAVEPKQTSVVPVLTLAEIYAGNYLLVPVSEPTGVVSTELVSDEAAFAQLDQAAKGRVCHFLNANFERFNNTLIKFVQRIFDAFNLVSKGEFKKELSTVNNCGSIYNNNEAINKAFGEIQSAMSNFAVKDLTTGMNAILYGYLPILYKYKKSENFNAKLANNMMYCKTLKLLGVAGKLVEPVRSYIMPIVAAPAAPVMQGGAKIKGGYEKFSTKEEDFKIYKPNSSTGKYLKALRELQIEYNTKFSEIYREILGKLESIHQEEINKLDNTKAATIIGQFEKILISSNRTTVYLSGILPTKNYSKQFMDAAMNLSKLCKAIGGCFEHLSDAVFKFVKLGKDIAQSYQKIRATYLESAKDASEMLINSENIDAFKVKCDLKKEDFIRKIDACQRIFAMCNNRSGVKMGSSTAEMLKKYISGMNDRDKMINEYFDSYTSGIKYILSQTHRSEDLAIIKPLISMKMILVDETKKAYLWLNQYLDKFLIDKRIEQLGKASLDKKTVEKIANAFVEFKKYSKIGLDELVRKYKSFLSSESMSNVSINSYFKLFKLAKQTFEEVDAFTYLEKLYNELGITDNTFNWPTFKSKLIGYLINGMIWFDIYEYREGSTEFVLMPEVCKSRGNHLVDHINPANIFSIEDSIIPEDVRSYAVDKLRLEDEDLKYRMKKISEILNMGCDIYTKQIAGEHEETSTWKRGKTTFAPYSKKDLEGTIEDLLKNKNIDLNAIIEKAKKAFAMKELSRANLARLCENNEHLARYIIDEVHAAENIVSTRYSRDGTGFNETNEFSVGEDFDDNFTNQNKYLYHYTNFGYALKKICMTNGNYKVAGVMIGFSMRHLGKVVSLFNGFEHYVIESLYTPIIQIIDKYIIQRYQGNRDFSTNTNDLLQGGDEDLKREAGSVFDIVEPHEPIESDIITQAVPFYISAYIILNYYAKHYSNTDDDMQLKLSISSISPLSDFKNKFDDKKFKIADEQDLKNFVSIMNEYWNSTTAQNEDEKLFNAVEHIISELNSMLIFGNDEKVIRLQESGIDESHLDIYTINFAKIHETLVKTITEAQNNLVRKGVNNNAAVEGYFAKKISDVKEATPSQRIGILKQILFDVYDPTKQDANNEYASFIDLCVSPMFIINEIYKNCIDMTKFTFKQEFKVEDAKSIVVAQLNQTKEFNKLALMYYEKGFKTVGDIVKHLFDEYYKDFDQTLHNIMNFPGLSDGQISAFLNNVHNTFKSLADTTKETIKSLQSFKTVESVEYVKNKILIPDTEIPSKLLQDIYIDETVFSPDTPVFANKETKSFTQFVVNVIASLSPSCFVPQIFSDLMKTSSLVNNTFEVMAKPKYEKKHDSYNPYTGKCLSTYIMCMSTTQTAANSMTSNQMTQTVANKYVSAIPMLIAILTKCSSVLDTNATYKVLIDKKNDYANYQNINARTEIGILIDILAKTYNDILPFSGEIQFMNGSTTTFSHYLSEIRHQLSTTGLNFKTFIQQPEKYEWIFERACPELKIRYKSYDRFKDYRTKFAVMLSDITFTKQFEVLLNILAKNIFRTFFSSIAFDPETSGNVFEGRLLGGDNVSNINSILNAFGLPCVKDSSHSILARLCELKKIEPLTLQRMFNNSEFINMLNEIRSSIHIKTCTDCAYAAFVNNTIEGNFPYKNTVSAPRGIMEAAGYVIGKDVFKYTTNLPGVVFTVVADDEYEAKVMEFFNKASMTYEKAYELRNAAFYNDGDSSELLNRQVWLATNFFIQSTEKPSKVLIKSEHDDTVITIPIPASSGIERTGLFRIENPFMHGAEWCVKVPAYKKAWASFNFLAILKAWEEVVESTQNFFYGMSKEAVEKFSNSIANQLDEINRATAVSIVYDVNVDGREDKEIKFISLMDFILNCPPTEPAYKNFPPCNGFWNLFALPTVPKDVRCKNIEHTFRFVIRPTDHTETDQPGAEIGSCVRFLNAMIPSGNNMKEMNKIRRMNDETLNVLFSYSLGLGQDDFKLINENGIIDREEITRLAVQWVMTDNLDRFKALKILRCFSGESYEIGKACEELASTGHDNELIDMDILQEKDMPQIVVSDATIKVDDEFIKSDFVNSPAIMILPFVQNGSVEEVLRRISGAKLTEIKDETMEITDTNEIYGFYPSASSDFIDDFPELKTSKQYREAVAPKNLFNKIAAHNPRFITIENKKEYIHALTKLIIECYVDETCTPISTPSYRMQTFINDVLTSIITVFKAVFRTLLILNKQFKPFKMLHGRGTVLGEIFESMAVLKNTYAKMVSDEKSLTDDDNHILAALILDINSKIEQQSDVYSNILSRYIKRTVDHISKYIISPATELGGRFMTEPLTTSGVSLESFNLIAESNINPASDFMAEQDGEILKAINSTLDGMETRFDNLTTDSLMVNNMTGGDLEDVDSSVLLNMYVKSDDKFRKFLATKDTDLETMIIAYFNKPLLSFNTYFNKNIFVEIIYNSALFKTSLMKIHSGLKDEKNKYWARLIDAVFSNDALKNPRQEDGVWRSRDDIKSADFEDKSVYGAITQPTTHRRFFEFTQSHSDDEENMFNFLNRIQGDGLTKLLLKIDACNEAVGTLAQWIKNFTFTNVEYNEDETFTKYDYDHEPFSY